VTQQEVMKNHQTTMSAKAEEEKQSMSAKNK